MIRSVHNIRNIFIYAMITLSVMSCRNAADKTARSTTTQTVDTIPARDTVAARDTADTRDIAARRIEMKFYDSIYLKVITDAVHSGTPGKNFSIIFTRPRMESFIDIKYTAYLVGTMQTRNRGVLKFVILELSRGMKGSFTNDATYIELVNEKDGLLGHYLLEDVTSVPTGIEGTSLAFDWRHNKKGCTKKTLVDFRDSIPSEVFIWCKEAGEVLSYRTEEKRQGH